MSLGLLLALWEHSARASPALAWPATGLPCVANKSGTAAAALMAQPSSQAPVLQHGSCSDSKAQTN